MGTVHRRSSTSEVSLPGRALVGRSPMCFVKIDESFISAEHAVIQWSGSHWTVRDLGSRNGTFVAGERLETGRSATIRAGATLAFGDLQEIWTLKDDSPPKPLAIELISREVASASWELLALPSDEEPEASIYRGVDGRWVMEQNQELKPVADQEVVKLDEGTWCLLLPESLDSTPLVEVPFSIEAARFRFAVSRNEEHVQMSLHQGGRLLELESREFHYALLVLARARLEDKALPAAERGWLTKEALMKMLAMQSTALNVSIHRARQQLLQASVLGAAGIVEVRRGERRFGSDHIEVVPL